MTEVRVYMRHVRAARFCRGGFRAWCAQNGIDHREIRDGYPVHKLRTLDCSFANRVCDLAEAEKEAEA